MAQLSHLHCHVVRPRPGTLQDKLPVSDVDVLALTPPANLLKLLLTFLVLPAGVASLSLSLPKAC